MPYDAIFNAQQHEPKQGGGKHRVGNKFAATITGTAVKDNKDANSGKHFEVTFTSEGGTIQNRYNLWNPNKQAVDISVGQLSALCHATGVFMVDMKNDGMALRGAKCLIDVGFQAGEEPTAEKPEGGYVELKKVYDVNGNEPGKGPAAAPQANTSGFTANPPNGAAPQVQQGWGGAGQAPQGNGQANPPAATSGPATGGWQQGGGTAEKPPWG